MRTFPELDLLSDRLLTQFVSFRSLDQSDSHSHSRRPRIVFDRSTLSISTLSNTLLLMTRSRFGKRELPPPLILSKHLLHHLDALSFALRQVTKSTFVSCLLIFHHPFPPRQTNSQDLNHTAWINSEGTGFAQERFQVLSSNGFVITHENLGIAKLSQDLFEMKQNPKRGIA